MRDLQQGLRGGCQWLLFPTFLTIDGIKTFCLTRLVGGTTLATIGRGPSSVIPAKGPRNWCRCGLLYESRDTRACVFHERVFVSSDISCRCSLAWCLSFLPAVRTVEAK